MTRNILASVTAILVTSFLAHTSRADAASANATVSLGGSSGDAAAPADAPATSDDKKPLYEKGGLAGAGLVVGALAGGGFSQPFSKLGTSFVGELELGYVLPPLRRSIEIFVSGQYAAPKTSGSNIADTFGPSGGSRIPGTMSYEVTEQQAVITLGGLFRIPLPTPLFRPYFSLGGRAYLLKTKVTGNAGGQAFGENDETATKFGFFGALGGEVHFGPGAVLLEVQTGYASVDGFVLRNTNVGSLNAALGYRLFI
jgi:hypothetical protein